MSMKAYRFVGLDKDVWLPDDIIVEIAIVPASVSNVRSNQYFTGQTSYTQHETANFNRGANADMHKRWLHGGAGGAYVGFNFVVDDNKIIQLTPLNEITWAAGTASGNKYSYHTELCVNNDINHSRARRNAAALAGGIMATKGWGRDKLVQHNIWWGKDCPYLLRREGRWSPFVDQAMLYRDQSLTAASGKPSPSPAPAPTSTLKVGDHVVTTDNLNVRQGSGTNYPVVLTLSKGSKAVIKDGPRHANNYVWFDLDIPNKVSGWAVSDWLSKTSAPAPATKDVVINGITFAAVPKGTKYRLSAATNVRQWASTDSKVIKTLPAGSVIEPTYEVDGDEVAGNKRWFVLGEPTSPGRVWSGTAKKV